MSVLLFSLKLTFIATLAFAFANPDNTPAAQSVQSLTDDEIFNNIGKTWILNEEVNKIIYQDKNIQSEIMRVGIPDACASIKQSSPQVLKEYEGAFKVLSVKMVRKHFQNKVENGTDPFFFHNHKNSLTKFLKNHHNDFFIEVANKSIANNLQHLKKLPDTQEDWRGHFADWDFTVRPHLPFSTACLLDGSSNLDKKRLAFDGFFKKKVTK